MPPPVLLIQEQVSLAPYTTFDIGGPTRFFCRVATETELLEAVRFARRQHLPLFVLGGGSNLLVSDLGFDGLVIQIALEGALLIAGDPHDLPAKSTSTYRVPAGMDWDALVKLVAEAGITGIECLAGIPGLVGASPIQNIGAYGQEVATSISSVRALDLNSLHFVELPAEACDFSYRRSIFNSTARGRYIITAVTFQFDLLATPQLTYADLQNYFAHSRAQLKPIDFYHAVREIRHRKGMLLVEGEADCRSAGSFFKNPIVPEATLTAIATVLNLSTQTIPHWPAGNALVKLPAAWLLERAGFPKGFTLGNAGISSRHTLALINRGNATAAEIHALRDLITKRVEERFHIVLEQEPVQLGS